MLTDKISFTTEYISIPTPIARNKDICIGAKYLYGLLRALEYNNIFTISNNDIMEELEISRPTLYKYFKQLEKFNCIEIEILDYNKRRITCLITNSIIIDNNKLYENEFNASQRKKREAELDNYIKELEKYDPVQAEKVKRLEESKKQFLKNIK